MIHQSDFDPIKSTPSLRLDGIAFADFKSSGGKAKGLLRLSPEWYPPTLIVPPAAHNAFRNGEIDNNFLSTRPDIARHLHEIVRGSTAGRIFLRSNAQSETLAERGQFESVDLKCDSVTLEKTIIHSWASVTDKAIQLGFLMQPLLDVKASGHLSNEYRVSRDATAWLIERGGWQATRQPERWRVHSSRAASKSPLFCRSSGDIEKILRSVAKRLSEIPVRHHLEWVWDGERIWIVQADVVEPLIAAAPGDAWNPIVGVDLRHDELAVWSPGEPTEGSNSLADWPKASALEDFANAALPNADVWRLAGATLITDLSSGNDVSGLGSDLQKICSGHVVIRTDIRFGTDELMLEKIGPTVNWQEALEWLRQTTRDLLARNIAADDISFIAHRFLASRASAWSLARPGRPIVNISSTWGTPDGLAWLPHDRAWVNIETHEVRRSIGGKTSFLDIDSDGKWTYRESPTEWIWRASTSEDELRTVATGSRRLADLLREPVLTMWFIGVQGRSSYYLPWFRMPPPADAGDDATYISPQNERIEIRSSLDLARFSNEYSDGSNMVLRITPHEQYIRDSAFVLQIAETATKTGAAVEIIGSSLAHPFYILRRAGVTVVCRDPLDEPTVMHNKLVRDGVLEHIVAGGGTATSYLATGSDLASRLRRKTVEEAIELLQAEDSDQVIEEMADLIEVLEALRRAIGYTRETLRDTQKAKRNRRGGFDSGAVLLSTGGPASLTRGIQGNALPLFDSDPSWDDSWQVRDFGNRIRLQCVPPLQDEPHIFRIATDSAELQIEYIGTSVEITVFPHQAPETPGPSLF